MNKINLNSTWAKLPRWKKRLEGFKCYIVALITCLIWPEATDSAMYDTLKTQFINTNQQGDETSPGA